MMAHRTPAVFSDLSQAICVMIVLLMERGFESLKDSERSWRGRICTAFRISLVFKMASTIMLVPSVMDVCESSNFMGDMNRLTENELFMELCGVALSLMLFTAFIHETVWCRANFKKSNGAMLFAMIECVRIGFVAFCVGVLIYVGNVRACPALGQNEAPNVLESLFLAFVMILVFSAYAMLGVVFFTLGSIITAISTLLGFLHVAVTMVAGLVVIISPLIAVWVVWKVLTSTPLRGLSGRT